MSHHPSVHTRVHPYAPCFQEFKKPYLPYPTLPTISYLPYHTLKTKMIINIILFANKNKAGNKKLYNLKLKCTSWVSDMLNTWQGCGSKVFWIKIVLTCKLFVNFVIVWYICPNMINIGNKANIIYPNLAKKIPTTVRQTCIMFQLNRYFFRFWVRHWEEQILSY